MITIIFNIFTRIVKFAIFLYFTGGIVKATYDLQAQSAKDVRRGLVSLTELNKQLFYRPHPHQSSKNLEKNQWRRK